MCKAYDRQDCTIPKKCSEMPIELEGRPSSSIYAANLLSKSYVFIKILYPHLTVKLPSTFPPDGKTAVSNQ